MGAQQLRNAAGSIGSLRKIGPIAGAALGSGVNLGRSAAVRAALIDANGHTWLAMEFPGERVKAAMGEQKLAIRHVEFRPAVDESITDAGSPCENARRVNAYLIASFNK